MDFTQLGGGSAGVDPKDPIALYGSLDKKQSHVEPRPAQTEILTAWATRRDERDVVLKLATGAGKTTLGLLMLYSHMLETKRPCLFLCPTNQLVGQVVTESERCGIPAVVVGGGQEIPPDALAGNSIVVTSVQSVFQARAGRFESAHFYAIVIDDAHTAVDIVRQQFTVTVPKSEQLYKDLLNLFAHALRDQSRGTAEEIISGHAVGALEVPYWVWHQQLDTVTKTLSALAKSEDDAYKVRRAGSLSGLPLHYGLIKNCLDGCRCFFSSKALEIAPEVPPVERVRTYHGAARRIFMSATISDEAVLVRELGCADSAARNPIQATDAGGVGERMILVPRLMASSPSTAAGWKDITELCSRVAARKAVVVLTPTIQSAKRWEETGALVVTDTNGVPDAVEHLRTYQRGLVVFANRYDGIDLPDEACRVLVLDGLPVAYSLMDMVDMACRGGGSVRRRALMQKIEQGMGRGVRSSSDYAVIILQGDDLVSRISMHENRTQLTDQTRRQLELGFTIAQNVKAAGNWQTEIETMVNQCLTRDAGWRGLYQTHAKAPGAPATTDKVSLARAVAEREAWNNHVSNRGRDAAATLRAFLNAHASAIDQDVKAFLLQRVAWYLRKDDPADSLAVQTQARELDHALLMPSSGVQYRKGASSASSCGAKFAAWIDSFVHPNAVLAAIDELAAKLIFSEAAPHEPFEEALCSLGKILGFESSRPETEFREGPDVLWLEGQFAVPLEAKNRTGPDTPEIAKHVAGQLMQSEEWTKRTHSERSKVVPVSVHPRSKLGRQASLPAAARVMTPAVVNGILDSLRVAVSALTRTGNTTAPDEATRKLTEQQLTLPAILKTRVVAPD